MNIELVFRFIGGILAGITAFQVMSNVVDIPVSSYLDFWLIYAICSASFGIGYLGTPYVTTRPFFWARGKLFHASSSDVLAGGIGVGFGLLAGALIAFPLSFLPGYFGSVLPVIASVVFGYLGMMTVITHKQALLGMVGLRGGRGESESGGGARSVLVDTSALIDGRIADVSRTGFLTGTLVIPRFVLEEIQHIADSSDKLRRDKGRRGLEIVRRLQNEPGCPVEISDMDDETAVGVDNKLVRLSRALGCSIVTNDFNLNKVARIQGIEVLNVNELANALRSVVMQNEEITVHIVQEGKEPGQGLAYLEDGTMIVVEAGRQHMNETVDVVVTKVLQTAAGRMVFTRIRPEANGRNGGPDHPDF